MALGKVTNTDQPLPHCLTIFPNIIYMVSNANFNKWPSRYTFWKLPPPKLSVWTLYLVFLLPFHPILNYIPLSLISFKTFFQPLEIETNSSESQALEGVWHGIQLLSKIEFHFFSILQHIRRYLSPSCYSGVWFPISFPGRTLWARLVFFPQVKATFLRAKGKTLEKNFLEILVTIRRWTIKC